MIHPRSFIGTPEPPPTRYKLQGVDWLLAHEVGVNTPSTGRYRSADPARVLSDARAAAQYGISANKTWEYNFMIGLDGSIFTQAGEYRGAHCLNFNTDSAGVIFLNATDVPLTEAQIAAWYEVRDHMVKMKVLSPNYQVAPHYRFRQTSCCGIHAEPQGAEWNSPTGQGRLGNLIPRLTFFFPPETVQRITTVDKLELVEATRWDSRAVFKEPPAPGAYRVKLAGSDGKLAALVNLTIANAKWAGWAVAYPSGQTPPKDSSHVNFYPTVNAANQITVPLASDGSFMVYINAPAHIIVEPNGYWT